MALRKAVVSVAVVVTIITAYCLVLPSQKPLATPIVISHYRLTLCQVAASMDSANNEEPHSEAYPEHQVWVKVQIEQADHWRDTSTNRPMLYGNYVIPSATLTAADGKPLKMFAAQAQSVDPLHFRVVHFIYDKFNPDGDRQKYYMVYGFDNSIQAQKADFEADVHIPANDVNGIRTPDQPPFIRPLRFDNLNLP